MKHAFSKYKNKPTERDGLKFDSQREARRYDELVLLKRAGEVIVFLTQSPRFRLPGGGTWTADFEVFWADGHVGIEDSKGYRTEAYKAKKRLVESLYAPIKIEER